MNIDVVVILIAIVGLSFFGLISCIFSLMKQVKTLHHLLIDTTREYKLYQAAAKGDYKIAGALRGISNSNSNPNFAGAKDRPVHQDIEEELELELGRELGPESELIISQHG